VKGVRGDNPKLLQIQPGRRDAPTIRNAERDDEEAECQ
jgi:hypothetical protein